MKKYVAILLFAVALSISGCQFFASATWINDHIDPIVRKEMAPLNKKLFEAFYARDKSAVRQMMSKALLDSSGKTIDTIVDVVGQALRSKNFTTVDEFYTTNEKVGNSVILKANKGNVNDYTIEYKALNSKSYAVLLKSEGMPVNLSILAVYGKYDDGWKVNIISANNYEILGKTAPEYYAMALAKYHKGDTIDAADNMMMATQIVRPGGKHLVYDDDDDMKTFYNGMLTEANANYHFPIVVKQVKTQPQIFGVNPQFVNSGKYQGVYPIVKYKSAINISDTVALKTENVALQKVIGSLFKGIAEDKKCVIYHVFNQLPDGKTPIKYYGFVQYLKP